MVCPLVHYPNQRLRLRSKCPPKTIKIDNYLFAPEPTLELRFLFSFASKTGFVHWHRKPQPHSICIHGCVSTTFAVTRFCGSTHNIEVSRTIADSTLATAIMGIMADESCYGHVSSIELPYTPGSGLLGHLSLALFRTRPPHPCIFVKGPRIDVDCIVLHIDTLQSTHSEPRQCDLARNNSG